MPRSTRALLVDRTFGPWFWGNVSSNTGNWLYNVTAAVLVYRLTASALLVGMVSVVQFLPLALLSPWAGALSDRMDRRLLMVAGQVLAAVSATAIAIAVAMLGAEGLPGAWPILVAGLGIGVGLALADPARSSLVPALVDDVDLESGVALTSLTFVTGRALGPAGAGVLLVTLGPEAAFVINAASFVPLIGALFLVRARSGTPAGTGDPSVRAGLRYVRGEPRVLLVLGGVTAAGFATDPVITLAPQLADVMGAGDALVAAFVSAFGTSAALTGFHAGRLQRRFGSPRTARSGMLALGAGLVIAAVAPTPALTLGGFMVAGSGLTLASTSFTSLLQRHLPDALRGRVMALWGVAYMGTRPLAAVLDGVAGDLVGPRFAMALAATVCLVGAVLASRLGRMVDGGVAL